MATTTKRLTKAEIRALLQGYGDALNAHDVEEVANYLTDDVVWAHPFVLEPLRGKEAVKADLSETYRSFPDLYAPVEDNHIYFSEDHRTAISTWTMVGTMSGPSPTGFESTGRFMRIQGVGFYTFRDGLICEYTMLYDGMEFARQLGILPSEKSLMFKALLEMQRWTTKARKAMRI